METNTCRNLVKIKMTWTLPLKTLLVILIFRCPCVHNSTTASTDSTTETTTAHVTVDGNWSDWSDWSSCSVSCGGNGTRSRNRRCDNPNPQFGGENCTGENTEVKTCYQGNCSGCRAEEFQCLNGECILITYRCDGTQDCNDTSDELNCNTEPTIDGGWSYWSNWSSCSVSCGDGTRIRSRSCDNPRPQPGGAICIGENTDVEACYERNCSVDGNWSDWSDWSSCSVSCGGNGTRSRNRRCDNPNPQFGGENCTGENTEVETCNQGYCSVDGNWSDWSDWSSCSVSCADGIRSRNRKCDNPNPQFGGENCTGNYSEDQTCNLGNCLNTTCEMVREADKGGMDADWDRGDTKSLPNLEACEQLCLDSSECMSVHFDEGYCFVFNTPTTTANKAGSIYSMKQCRYTEIDGGWSDWSDWSACSVSCGSGTHSKNRTCDNPRPKFGGANCSGENIETETCNQGNCSVDGNWSDWLDWSSCSVSCGGNGTRSRNRRCDNPNPQFGGENCTGESTEVETCNQGYCSDTTCEMVREADKGGMDADWDRGDTKSLPNLEACEQLCLDSSECMSVHFDEGYCFVFNTPTTTANKAGSIYSMKQCRYTEIDGGWSDWSDWSACSVSCGNGTHSKNRTCNNPRPQFGGANCSGENIETETCNQGNCSVDGNWSDWSDWSSCSVSCDDGTRSRNRRCDNPNSQFGGENCTGNYSEDQTCNLGNCLNTTCEMVREADKGGMDADWDRGDTKSQPNLEACEQFCLDGPGCISVHYDEGYCFVYNKPTTTTEKAGSTYSKKQCRYTEIDGGWSDWSDWSACSVSCGNGTRGRNRTCNNPRPQFGGANCSGENIETETCNQGNCSVDGNWSDWSDWSSCSVSCDDGTRSRNRRCDNPNSQFGGENCTGNYSEDQTCNLGNCLNTTCEMVREADKGGMDADWDRGDTKSQPNLEACEQFCLDGPGCISVHYDEGYCFVYNKPTTTTEKAGSTYSKKQCRYTEIDGGWSDWSDWSACSVSCGNGTRGRNRTCNNPRPQFGGANCSGENIETETCNQGNCSVDGNWSDWSDWSSCSVSCDDGTRSRNRRCDNPNSQFGGENCTGNYSEDQTCNLGNCLNTTCEMVREADKGGMDADWDRGDTKSLPNLEACEQVCLDGPGCISVHYDEGYCFVYNKPTTTTEKAGSTYSKKQCRYTEIDGGWSDWSDWSACSVSCGNGTRGRNRTCNNPRPQFGGANCSGENIETETCNQGNCSGCRPEEFQCLNGECILITYRCDSRPDCSDLSDELNCTSEPTIDGGWSNWSDWSSCFVSCGDGTRIRSRSCDNPRPQSGGATCSGENTDFGVCNQINCSVDGSWSDWSDWSSCSVSCGNGTHSRNRTCDNPNPQFGGENCTGENTEVEMCSLGNCSAFPPPTNGGWSAWSVWSQCSVSCGSGSRSRYRACDNPAPQYGGANCTGDHEEKETCNERKCSELLPYGLSVGDSILIGDDVSTRPLRCFSSIPFLGGYHNHNFLTISSNGLVCLGCTYSSFTPVPLGSFRLPYDIITPFWTDLYPGRDGSGPLYYQVYSEGDSSDNHTQTESIIDKVSTAVNYYAQTKDFKASCVYVATWDNTVFYGSHHAVHFQFVLATDGGKTYAYTFYNDVNILFPPPGRKVAIGYTGQGTSHSSIFSYTDAAFRISQLRGNTFDSANKLYFMTLHKGSPNPSPSALCFRWYWKNIADNTGTRLWNGIVSFNSICPCNKFMLFFDGRFQPVDKDGYGDCYVNNDFGGLIPSHICCYHPFWGFFLRGRPAAGSMVSANPRTDPIKYYSDNVVPKENCCYKSDRCNLYYSVRPTGVCYRVTPFGIFFIFGDPHIDTLDGYKYTFNGWGEYTMMKIDNATFEVQARTSLATSVTGNETKIINATVFTAFAAKEGENFTLQVELTSDLKSMSVFGNGQDFTAKFYDISSNFTEYLSGLVLKRTENFTLTAVFSSGIQLTIQVKTRQLTLSASIPTSFKGMVQGLMGNFDDNKTNEFILPGGTQLPDSDVDSERKIYNNFGKRWATTAQTSVFTYDDGKSWFDYSHPDFVPLFIDEFNQTTLEQAYSVCGGSSDQYKACIFDYLATGDQSFAEDTQSTNNEAEAETEQLKNEAPSIGGDENIEAVVGSPVTLNYFGSDDSNTFVYNIINQPSSGVTADNSTGNLTLTWTPSNLNTESILVTTRDDRGLTAESIEVEIKMCSGCNGNGTCNYEVLRNETNPNFMIASCDCNVGYTGDDCDEDFDGCVDDPCALRRNCTDLTPDQQVQFNRSYNCSGCPAGYTVTSDEKCEDIDECSNVSLNNCPANSNCFNTEGSFTCPCLIGFRKVGTVCQDIDECTERTSGCDQNCDNTDGNFTCSCVFGFELLSDGKTCNQTITDVCELQNLTCSYGCDNTTSTDGIWKCICKKGYQVQNDGTCSNINECEQNVCTQNCTDSEGSYTCSCFTGYKLTADGTTCTACESPYYGDNCAQICSCGPGAVLCDPSRGCVCNSAWTGPNCDQDVDECTTSPGICGNDKTCTNTNGHYECSCTNAGYEKISEDNSVPCSDINECISPTSNNCSTIISTCSNTGGGYTCTCNTGYQQKNSYECEDVNECTTGSHNCQQQCFNTVGSYNCRCFYGFELNADRKTCTQVSDPCASFGNLTCSYACKLNGNSTECYCEAGYQLQEDQQTCDDINECSDDSTNLCSDNTTCTNNVGSFNCSCPVGKFLENDQRTCTVCDQFHWGDNCANACGCGPGAEKCDPVTGCVCKSGWQGTKCDADINECNNLNNPCETKSNEKCVNTPGSYVCQCMTGYQNVSGTCQDIDECLTNPCDHECTNDLGSYTCSCRPGFQFYAKQKCQDIDECDSTLNKCSQNCLNTVGSYKCSCNDGYILSQSDQRTCNVKTECSIFNCTSPGSCAVRANGEEYCTCPTWYNLTMTDNTTGLCENIDECDINPCEDSCTDKTPGYACSCTTNGTTLAADLKTCTDCDDGYWGQNCTENCTCVEVYTKTCHKSNGTCECKTGWKGDNCDQDVNECISNTFSCQANSQCQNTNGSYDCVCNSGYINSNGVCVACDSGYWGQNCAENCTCVEINTKTCHKSNGTCECKTGWEGENCDQDIDECTSNTFSCQNNSYCQNTNGSYVCVCDPGYINSNDICVACEDGYWGQSCAENCTCVEVNTKTCHKSNGTCECKTGWEGDNCDQDIDECTSNTFSCQNNSYCQNTNGSYVCVCDPGYINSNDVCVACDDGYWGQSCGENCTCVEVNTKTCHKSNGTCECKTGWMGDNCEQDVNECTSNTFSCQANSQCQNTNGSYVCVCDPGYSNSNDTCNVCDSDSWGINCTETCTCESANTQSCNNVDGNCTCNNGWEGATCTDDIDECTLNTTICAGTPNSDCQNTNSSFVCNCKTGYQKKKDGTCGECNSTTFGESCNTTCTCVMTNTADCNNVNGICTCQTGWNGTNCDEDINECLNLTICDGIPNTSCQNNNGGYDCVCDSGYTKNASNLCEISIPTTAYTPNTTEVTVRVVLTLAYTVDENDDLTNENTDYYKTLFNYTEKGLTEYYSSYKATKDSFVKVVLYKISKGSLIADHTVVLKKNSGGSQNNVIAASNNLLKGGGSINISGTPVGANHSVLEDKSGIKVNMTSTTSLCDAFYQLNTCPFNQECAIGTSQTPYCLPLQSTDSFLLVMGLGVGISLFFMVLVLIVALCIYHKKGKKPKEEDDNDYDRNQLDQGFFTSPIAGKFNSWKCPSPYFNSGLGYESPESDRGAYDNETWRPQDPDTVYDNNRRGKAPFSWDFMYRSNLAIPFRIKRPERVNKPHPDFDKKDSLTSIK